MKKIEELKRRDVLKRITAMTGLAMSSSLVMGFLSGCDNASNTVEILPKDNLEIIASMSNLIIPDTDTGGAIAAGVPDYINLIINQWFEADEKKVFLQGIARVDTWSRQSFGKSYLISSEKQKFQILEHFDNEIASKEGEKTFFQTFKQLTLLGYFTSEIGAEETLRYEAVPGPYEGCLDFNEIGRTWAT